MKTIAELSNSDLRQALEMVKAEVRRIVGNSARLFIYGSYARGEEREDSDVDLIVLLPDEMKTYENEDLIRERIYNIGFDNGFVISVMIASESHARTMTGFLVYGSVEREGIPL